MSGEQKSQIEDVPSEHSIGEERVHEEGRGPTMVEELSQVFQSRIYPAQETHHSQDWHTRSEASPNMHNTFGNMSEDRKEEKPLI